jgi:hypothetical protein
LVVQGPGDIRYVNTGEVGSITPGMLALGAVHMDHTSAPIGAATVSQTLTTTATTLYLMSGQPLPVDSSGTCLLTASVRVPGSAPTGYFYTYPAYQQNMNLPSGISGTNVSYGMATTATTVFQSGTVTGVVPVSAGNTYQFGCVVYISSGSTFANNTFSCNVSWLCN